MSRFFSVLALIAVLIAACTEHRSKPDVPRPTAYPRLQTYPADYNVVTDSPFALSLNRHAQITTTRPDQDILHATARYPLYGASVHVSAMEVPTDVADSLVELRRQRMVLNLGASSARETALTSASGKFEGVLLEASAACPSPLQLVAVGETGHPGTAAILSATLFLDQQPAEPDSLRPVITALRGDILQMLDSL